MNKRTVVTLNEVLSAIPLSRGQIQPIEHHLNCTRSAVKKILEQFPEAQQELDDEYERQKDMMIVNAIEDAKAGDPKARELILKAIARDRGFGDKLEVSGKDGQPLVFLHAVAANLTANENNNFASKNDRIASWSRKAVEYHEQQKQSVEAAVKEYSSPARKNTKKKTV